MSNFRFLIIPTMWLFASIALSNSLDLIVSNEEAGKIGETVSRCTPPRREVCGPVHPGPGPIICRCV